MANMSSTRRTALVAGVFFLATEVTSIPALLLYQPVLRDGNYIVGSDADNRVLLGGLLELLLVVAVIGTAVTLYPVVKRQNHSVALGYVCGRLLEAAIIVVGAISVLTVVTLRQDRPVRRTPAAPRSPQSRSLWWRSTTGHSCSGRAGFWESTASCWRI
jgi:hypothetical protein